MDSRFDEIIEKVKKGKRFLVVSHVNPEGDAVGSLIGMALALKGMGKDVTAYLEDPVPENFSFLPGADTVTHSLAGAGGFDVTFAVDCGQKDRLGKGFIALKEPGIIINIDHHITNDLFGGINVIAPEASSAGEVVYDLCKAAGIKVTKDIAVNLYVAILTDTGSFRYSCSTPEAFIKAGELVRLGADPWDVSTRIYENYPAKKYKLLGMVLSTLEVVKVGAGGPDDSIAMVTVTQEMFKKSGADKDHADGFVNYARGIQGVAVGVLFRETGPNEYKVSMRSKGSVDVSAIALSFGGGGHANAAGCSIKGTLEEVRAKISDTIRVKVRSAALQAAALQAAASGGAARPPRGMT